MKEQKPQEEDLGHKLLELQRRSEHPEFEHVGYINWVHDQTETHSRIKVDVVYPDGEREFSDYFDWPKDFTKDSRLKRAVESKWMPFDTGSFDNDSLQDEAVPIDPDRETIVVPKKRADKVKELPRRSKYLMDSAKYVDKHGLSKFIAVMVVKALVIIVLTLIAVSLLISLGGMI